VESDCVREHKQSLFFFDTGDLAERYLDLAAFADQCFAIERAVKVTRLIGQVKHTLQKDCRAFVSTSEVTAHNFITPNT
jgi:hypothetical protein